jgi:hypothetical protein
VQSFSDTAAKPCSIWRCINLYRAMEIWMTSKTMNVMLAGVALAMLTAAPALACPTCGLGTVNALAPNLLTNNTLTTSAQPTNSAGALGRVVAVELPRR